MNPLYHYLFLLALPVSPLALYVFVYMTLRFLGFLSVTAGGWHAGGLSLKGKSFLSAFGLFTAFQPLLRLESATAGLLEKIQGAETAETVVSEVVVEVVSMA